MPRKRRTRRSSPTPSTQRRGRSPVISFDCGFGRDETGSLRATFGMDTCSGVTGAAMLTRKGPRDLFFSQSMHRVCACRLGTQARCCKRRASWPCAKRWHPSRETQHHTVPHPMELPRLLLSNFVVCTAHFGSSSNHVQENPL